MLLDPNFKSLDPKVVVEFEPTERGREDFISKADLVDVQCNSFCAHLLLAFNLKEKMPIFNNYVREVMIPDNVLEAKEKAVEELDKMICEDTRLADYLEVDVVDQLAKMLREGVTYSTFNHSVVYVLSRTKIDACDVIIREKVIPSLVHTLSGGGFTFPSPKDALPIFITLTRFARVSPNYVRDMLDGRVLKWVDCYIRLVVMGTSMMDIVAKFMVAICQTNILSDSENFICCRIIGFILSMELGTSFHREIACYALQYLSYERPTGIYDQTIFILTELSCNQNITVAVSALGVLGNIMRWGNVSQIESLVVGSHNLIRCLQTSLSDSKPMKFQWEVCLIISKIADRWPTFAQIAIEQFRNHTRKLVGESISAALHKLKSRGRERPTSQPQAIEVLNKILEFNALLIALKKHPRTRSFAQGLGSISFLDGGYDGDRKMDDLELLYRTYLTDYLFNGRIEEDKLAALNQLRKIFGLGEREVESITLDVTSKEYRYRLGQSIISGRLEAAKSKEGFLQNLCEELNFNAQKAVEIHEEIYRQKLHHGISTYRFYAVVSLKSERVLRC
ncbi:hypothetical protein POM88_054267 [Heracleum sosnowskyi]|uniref:Uncharacterized protein n=1 Tax=Heracleum sosnowskyi TaxID=360622 RepID=A0AAD8GP03_9APIA|nr:hypothetical protein POM88_054267 [Heracleum sosnowskyi]